MDGKLKIGVIVGIAFVAGIIGTLSFASLYISEETVVTQSDPNNQNIGIGAYVIVEAYDKNGALKQKFEGHNDLTIHGINALVGCMTGNTTIPTPWVSCGVSNSTSLRVITLPFDGIFYDQYEEGTLTLKPDGCLPEADGGWCNGWELIAIYDFPDSPLPCNQTSCNATGAMSLPSGTTSPFFNTVDFDTPITISQDDRVKVNMTFNISP